MTHHNIAYMMKVVRDMRNAIMEDKYADYVNNFVLDQFRGSKSGGQDVPIWVENALQEAGIKLNK
jgi:queuine tRNA-ribosyltransferase